jgi:uncharacterized protein
MESKEKLLKTCLYTYTMPGASHWSLRLRRGHCLKITDIEGNANLGMLMYNPEDLLERYNAPDTLKCQHTFKLTAGHCLYSDMGRIFCSIIQDDLGWHETVCGNSHAATVAKRWGARDYQTERNQWNQNGCDSFLVELAKYGLSGRDMAANINWFSKVTTDNQGDMHLMENHSRSGSSVTLRFEMDSLVIMHSCPHPLNNCEVYPRKPVLVEIYAADAVAENDFCKNSCAENQRGFANNRLYYLG